MTKRTKWVCTQRRLRSTWASAQSDQSQSGHPPSLIRVFTVRMPRLICLHWVHSFCWFCHVTAHLVWSIRIVFALKMFTILTLVCFSYFTFLQFVPEFCNFNRSKICTGLSLNIEIVLKVSRIWSVNIKIWHELYQKYSFRAKFKFQKPVYKPVCLTGLVQRNKPVKFA